jgi:hypothetical protein
MDDELREMLIRIDERVKALDVRINKIETRLENMNMLLLKNGNRWRERGILAGMASIIVAVAEIIKRVVSVV